MFVYIPTHSPAVGVGVAVSNGCVFLLIGWERHYYLYANYPGHDELVCTCMWVEFWGLARREVDAHAVL